MFGKFKDKLKKTLSVFSKKTEEEAEVEEQIVEVEKPEPSKSELLDLDADRSIDVKENQIAESEKEEIILDQIDAVLKSEKVSEKKKVKLTHKEDSKKKNNNLPSAELLLAENRTPEPSKSELLDANIDSSEEIKDFEETQAVKEQIIEEIATKAVQDKKEKRTKKKKESTVKVEKQSDKKEKSSFFKSIKQKLTTKIINQEKFEELFWDLELVLLQNNVSVKVIEKLKSNLSEELVDKPLPRDVANKIQEVLKSTLQEILSIEQKDIILEIKKSKDKNQPYTIIFFGINGSGKTTTIAKLANYLKNKKLSVVLAAGDTFRAAAIDQLQDHADKLDIKLIKHDYGSDAAAVAFDAKQYAQKNNIDVVLIDTAGRLHSNTNLMAELEKIMRVTDPDCKIFIGESITGNDCVEQAEKYTNSLGIDGIILTKADIDEMGGAPLSICYVTGKPILFLGMGQEYKDLVPFSKELILEKLGF